MKIVYSPFYSGNYFMNMQDQKVALDVQVLETNTQCFPFSSV